MKYEPSFEMMPFELYVDGQEFYEISGTSIPSRRDLIHPRIDFHAQEALYRMFRGDPGARVEAAQIFDAVKAGQLAGIYIVNQGVPAMRAQKMKLGWWQVIPKDQDAVLLLDPNAPLSGPPLIAFVDAVKADSARLIKALRSVWETFQLFRTRNVSRCPVPSGAVFAETSEFQVRLRNVVPAILCAKSGTAITSSSVFSIECRYEPNEEKEAERSLGEVQPLFFGPRVLESALLFDFAVGSATPKRKHKDYFARIIAENDLANPKSEVRVAIIEGFTDCVDTEAVNAPLRFQRAEAVALRLFEGGVHPDNLGEFRGAASGENPGDNSTKLGRARNRSVTVLLEKRQRALPPEPSPAQAGLCPGSTVFSVRLLGGFTLSKPGAQPGPAGGQLVIEIVDQQCFRAQTFVLTAGGVSAGTPSISPEPSDEKFFITERPLLFKDFEGLGLWESIGVQPGVGATFDGIAIPHLIMSWFGLGAGINVGGSILLGAVKRSGKERKQGGSGSLPHDPER
jgi:outer membrane protein OmpA-like peptidoglycan-associated protein